jgi:eukaryotic-like serine/threonine-protein kinase
VPKRATESSWACRAGDELVPGLRAWTLLGDGRRCETWLAWCARRWAPVAVKLPRPDQVNPEARQALAREARSVRSLTHASIQRLLEARLDGPVPHLIFEYIEGPTLASLLDEHGPLAPGDAVRLGLQVGAVLHYLHGLGVAHLDVKPQNLAVREGRAVLLDFDLASRLGQRDGRGRLRGSPPYMPPEQIARAPATPAMDLFALGATLYEAVTDRLAFDAVRSTRRTRYPQLAGPPPPVRSFNPRVPARLERAIATLLAPDPADRPPSAVAAMELLAGALPRGEPGLWPRWVGRSRAGAA